MLRQLNELIGYKIEACDGEIGKVDDFYFDDKNWEIKYLVDKTGSWLFGRQVLISPSAFKTLDWENEKFPVSISKEMVKDSPSIEDNKPVSKESIEKLNEYYHWSIYTGGYGMTHGAGNLGMSHESPLLNRSIVQDEDNNESTGLRSCNEVKGYNISTNDGQFGYVDDFIVDDHNWLIRYLVIDTKKFLDGKKVLVAPEWIKSISWRDKNVFVDMAKKSIKKCPEYNTENPISRQYEELIYNHYGYNGYWG